MAAPMWRNEVTKYIKLLDNSAVETLSNGLQGKSISLLELIENIGEYLTNEDHQIRGRVIRLLCDVIAIIPNTLLSPMEVKSLVTYLCERLQDHHSIQPQVLRGLLTLITRSGSKLPEGCAETICKGVFKEVQVQSLSQTDRCTVFNIFTALLDKKLTELQTMGNDFVFGFIQSMDTEKDPRNLLLAFHCAWTIILNFSLGPFVEEMFEVTSCYFPIDFTPPPNDEYGITRQDLILALRGCLSACPEFGPLCVPLLLDKLQSDIGSAVLDSLLTLSAGAMVYGAKCIKEFQGPLFRCIKQEITTPKSPEIEIAAESALTAISTALSSQVGLSTDSSEVDVFIKEVMQDCKRHFSDEDLRLFKPSCKLFLAIAKGSDHACCVVIQQMVPVLEDMYNKFTGTNQRKQIIEMLVKFLCSSRDFIGGRAPKVVSGLTSSCLKILLSAASQSNVTLTSTAVQGLGELMTLSNVLKSGELKTMCWCILDRVLNSKDKGVRSSCMDPCKNMMKVCPEISSEILPKLLDKIDPVEGEDILGFVAIFAADKNVISNTTQQLLSKLQQKSLAMGESSSQICLWIASCLIDISVYVRGNSDCVSILSTETIPSVYRLVVSNSVSDNYSEVLSSPQVLQSLSTFIRNTVILLDSGLYSKLYNFVTNLYFDADKSDLGLKKPFTPLQSTSPSEQTSLVTMLTPVICASPKHYTLPDLNKYRDTLCDLSLRSNHDYTKSEAAKCLAGILNKALEDEDLTAFLQSRCEFYEQNLTCDSKDTSCLQQCVWVTKALVMRGHREANKFVKILLRLLGSETLGDQAAEGFGIIHTEYEDVLNPSMHANNRFLYKQRFFTENSTHLTDGFQTASSETKKNYLIALSHCLKSLPKSVLVRELPQLFPMLVQSLLCENVQLQQSTMETLCTMITDAPNIIVKHVDTVIPQLLKLTSYKPSMKVRCAALRCLHELVSLPSPVILPYRPHVIKTLEGVLDDKKRLVRLEAVKSRNEWCLLGQPGGRT
ncbi:MMS19 nucleotide excision repair protein homolog [Saccostrea echinata]|uniref:MMS19 nucleotide excision repair protein homolog n=1 Tax=Saccostrea echinata TaxID=191078 RepID=UPI002A8015B6|nr:MMS19 nucleotide excision repair protein homolog [Saccostrea echinata]